MQNKILGLSLIELLISILILSILAIFGFSMGSNLYRTNQLNLLKVELCQALRFARARALTENLSLVLSPKPPSKDWSQGMILYRDIKDHKYNQKEQLIYQWDWSKSGIQINWVGFDSNDFLLFSKELKASTSSGHFLLKNKEARTLRIVLNRLGRIKIHSSDPGKKK